MSRRSLLALALLSIAPAVVSGDEKQNDPAAANQEVRNALIQFDRGWKDYTNEPHFGDPRWKLKREALVRLARAGPGSVALLEAVAKKDSAWQPHTRNLASEVLAILRGPRPVRETLASYDLAKMDTAAVGK